MAGEVKDKVYKFCCVDSEKIVLLVFKCYSIIFHRGVCNACGCRAVDDGCTLLHWTSGSAILRSCELIDEQKWNYVGEFDFLIVVGLHCWGHLRERTSTAVEPRVTIYLVGITGGVL